MMLEYLPGEPPTLRNKIINTIVGHLKQQTALAPGLGEIVVLGHGEDHNIPEGITYIFPRGAIGIDPPDWVPIFDHKYENGKFVGTILNPAHVMLYAPDFVYRIEADNHITGAGFMARETAEYLNKVYYTGGAK